MAKADKKKTVKSDKDEKAGGAVKELISTVLWALGIALILRTFLFQPFHIPSGSMYPGLREGDYIITSKFTVGYGEYAAAPLPFPRKNGRLFERELTRGDVIVFRPEGSDKNFIKRLIGMPGDQVQIKDGHVFLNGARLQSEKTGEDIYVNSYGREELAEVWTETFDNGDSHIVFNTQNNGRQDRSEIRTIPAGYYFLMGDNRDHSRDSRVPASEGGAGIVPSKNIMGKAEFVLLSVNENFVLYKPWTWANMRGDRFFKSIK